MLSTTRVELLSLDMDAIAASFQEHITREVGDPRQRAASLMALAASWWLATAGQAGIGDTTGTLLSTTAAWPH